MKEQQKHIDELYKSALQIVNSLAIPEKKHHPIVEDNGLSFEESVKQILQQIPSMRKKSTQKKPIQKTTRPIARKISKPKIVEIDEQLHLLIRVERKRYIEFTCPKQPQMAFINLDVPKHCPICLQPDPIKMGFAEGVETF